MSRPRRQVDIRELLRLRQEGCSFPEIARRLPLGLGTVHPAYQAANVPAQGRTPPEVPQQHRPGTDRPGGTAPGPMQVRVVIVPTPEAPDAVKQIDAEPVPVLAKPSSTPVPVPAPMPPPSARAMLGETHPVERRPPPTIRGEWQ